MNRKKLISILLAVFMLVTVFSACAKQEEEPAMTSEDTKATEEKAETEEIEETEEIAEPVNLTYYSTSAEVNTMFEDMFVAYNELNPNVTIELIPTGVGEGQSEKLQTLYASNNAPTFMNIDPATALEYKTNLFEFTYDNSPWMDILADGAIESGTFGGEILGVPFSVQGYGLNYNKRVVEEIYGGSFDPTTINTQDDLRAFFEKIEAAGVPATMWHGANWSLGAHYLGLTYAVHGPATADGVAVLNSLINGEADIFEDKIFQGYMDTFKIMSEFNYNKVDPLVGDYNKDAQAYASGEVATYFMGDWLWTVVTTLEDKDTEYGFIPLPWSNDPQAYGNSQVVVTMPKVMCIDKSQSTEAQQNAAVDALEWMLTEEAGQAYFLDAGFMMPYTNVKETEFNSMTQSISDYVAAGKTINIGCFSYMTGDAWTQTGDLMLQYLVDSITREELAEGINAYWQSTK